MNSLKKLWNYLELAGAYVKLNFKSQLEYRAAFISQVCAMFINDGIWVAFWSLFFIRFPVVHGWGAVDVITLWAVCCAGFGLAHTVCGNAIFLASMIAKGELDAWMLYPRALLPHILVGRMSPSSFGDALFGIAVYLAFARPDLPHLLMFTFLVFSVAVLFVGFSILSACLSFYIGNTETLTDHWRFAMITFSTYPSALFEGTVRILLFTLVPAAFVSYYPIEALRHLSLGDALISLAGSVMVTVVSVAVFYHGLGRYESGNALTMRG